MNCPECKDQLAGFIEGLLDKADADRLESHLGNCPTCRTEFAKVRELCDRLVQDGRPSTLSLETKVMDQIMRKQAKQIRRITMLTHKRFVAAAIVAAVLLCATAWGAHLAYGAYKQYLQERGTRTFRVEPSTTQVVKIRNSKGEVVQEIEVKHPPSSVLVYDSQAKQIRIRERKQLAILKAAIAGKTYRFIEVVFPPNAPKQFAYELTSP